MAEFYTIEDALAYFTECNLATLDHLHSIKRSSKSERQRQSNICDSMVRACRDFGIDARRTQSRLSERLSSTSTPEHP